MDVGANSLSTNQLPSKRLKITISPHDVISKYAKVLDAFVEFNPEGRQA